jgi:uncharacterized protein YegL
MPNAGRTEVVVLLDRSGSMQSIRHDMEGGLELFVKEQQADKAGECRLTLVQFDNEPQTVFTARAIDKVPRIELVPRGSTALLDALGSTIESVGKRLSEMDEAQRPGKVLVLVITDGEENSSRRFTQEQVKAMVEHQTETYQWQFAYLGANVDAFAQASRMGIATQSASSYSADSAGARGMLRSVSRGVSASRAGGSYEMTDDERAAMGGAPAQS